MPRPVGEPPDDVEHAGTQIQDPSSPLWTLGPIAILAGLSVVIGLFVWALRVLQEGAVRREFFDEAEELQSST